MQIPLESLMPGDVLLFKYSDTYWHTTLVLTNQRVAHAPSPGTPCVTQPINELFEELKEDHKLNNEQAKARLYAYRFTGNKPHGSGWETLAEQWCGKDANDRITRYSPAPNDQQRLDPNWKNYPRYRGVLKGEDDSHNAQSLPFEIDALSRTVKWALKYRTNEAFSINRGTTCCAFVLACIQTVFINAAFSPGSQGLQDLRRANELIEQHVRGQRITPKGEASADHALIANANRGYLMPNQAKRIKGIPQNKRNVPAIWDRLYEMLDYRLLPWSDVGLPASVQYDAKYLYSRTFNHILANSGDWAAK